MKYSVNINDGMIVDENDKQSVHDNKVMLFVYFTMYGMMRVALAPNHHIALMSRTLLIIIGMKIHLTFNKNLWLVLIIFTT